MNNSTFDPPEVWFQVELLSWLVGLAVWAIGIMLQWRLVVHFRRKMGRDPYDLRNAMQRYLRRPWLWLVEWGDLTRHMMSWSTTPIGDAELEAMRHTYRRWITIGGLLIVAAVFWFLVPVVWLMVTTW